MNLIGKILVTLIFVMSLVYLGFATTVYSTHKDFKAINKKLNDDINVLTQKKTDVEAQLAAAAAKLQAERDAAQDLLAKAQSKRDELDKQVAAKEKELAEKEVLTREAVAQAAAANTNLKTADEKVAQLRDDIQKVRDQRDENFKKVVALTTEKNEESAAKKRLEEVNANLADQVAKAKLVLDRNGLSINTNVAGVPPKVDGIVLFSADPLVEISIGSDDGLAPGHTLEVSRGAKYMGRVRVIRTTPDRAVAEVMRDYLKGKIEKDDRVATRIN